MKSLGNNQYEIEHTVTGEKIVVTGEQLPLYGLQATEPITPAGGLPTVDITKIPTASFGISEKGVSLKGKAGKGVSKPKGISITSPTKSKGIKFAVRKQKEEPIDIGVDMKISRPPETSGISLSKNPKPQKIKPRRFKISKFRVTG